MAKQQLIFIDAETSGLNPHTDQILSLSMKAVDSETGEIVNKTRIKLGYRGDVLPSPEAVLVNRINPIRARGVTEREAAEEIQAFINNNGGSKAVMVGHNVGFDLRFMRSLMARNGLNAKSIPLAKIDTHSEGVRAIKERRLPIDKLEQKRAYDSTTYPSLTLKSLAGGLGVEVAESSLHDDDYDTDVTIGIWKNLGMPGYQEPKGLNNPFETHKFYGNSFVKATIYDRKNGSFNEKYFYVVGDETTGGIGPEELGNKAVLVDVGSADFQDAVVRLRKERADNDVKDDGKAKRGGVTATAIGNIALSRGFNSSEAFNVTAVAKSDLPGGGSFTDDELAHLSNLVWGHEKKAINDAKSAKYQAFLEASGDQVFSLDDPNNETNLIRAEDNLLIPDLANKYASLDEDSRMAAISELANSQSPPRGKVWCHNMLRLSERYGFRNKIEGYEEARTSYIKKNMPRYATTETVKGKENLAAAVSKKMAADGVEFVSFKCDGLSTKVSSIGANGNVLAEINIPHASRNGYLTPVKVGDIDAATVKLIGCSASAAPGVRSGFQPFADNNSHSARRRILTSIVDETFRKGDIKGVELLSEIHADYGGDEEDFLKATADQDAWEETAEDDAVLNSLVAASSDMKSVEKEDSGDVHRCTACRRLFRGTPINGMGPTCAAKHGAVA